jgi:hypothetical protein
MWRAARSSVEAKGRCGVKKRSVVVAVVGVGQAFGCCGEIRDARDGTVLDETNVYPNGFEGAAERYAAARALERGWTVVEPD